MKIVVIGSVAAGTSAAAKARRNDESAEIIIYEKDSFISYSGCGLPFFLGGEVESIDSLVPRNPEWFKKRYNIEIKTGHEVLSINAEQKTLSIKNKDEIFEDNYDRLIIATGSSPFVPEIEGIDSHNVFTIKNPQNAINVDAFINKHKPKNAVIIGGGYIGLEMCQSLTKKGIKVTIVDAYKHIMPFLDEDMSIILQEYLLNKGVLIKTSKMVKCFEIEGYMAKAVVLDGEKINADIFIWATGVKPNVSLAKEMGIDLGVTGAIKVNSKMQTNILDVYAAGDCCEAYSAINGKPLYLPMGSTANKMGRIAGDSVTGGDLEFRGVLGTAIVEMLDMVVAVTGLSEKDAISQGYDALVVHNIKPDKPEYLKNSTQMTIKAVADKKTGAVLGVQIVGFEGVDKRIDVFVAAISFGAKAEDFFHLDLAYAPPFSTTKDPVIYTGMVLDNALNRGRKTITATELKSLKKSTNKHIVLDVRSNKDYEKGHIDGALNYPLDKLRKKAPLLDKDAIIVTYCNKGVTGNAAQNVLLNLSFKEVYNLSGGYTQYKRNNKLEGRD